MSRFAGKGVLTVVPVLCFGHSSQSTVYCPFLRGAILLRILGTEGFAKHSMPRIRNTIALHKSLAGGLLTTTVIHYYIIQSDISSIYYSHGELLWMENISQGSTPCTGCITQRFRDVVLPFVNSCHLIHIH